MKMHAIKMSDIAKEITLEVELKLTGTRWWAVRLWIGRQLIKLAALIIGCGLEFKGDQGDER